MRRKIIAANWKMYKTPAQAELFMRSFLPLVADHTRDRIVVCPPFVCLPVVTEMAKLAKVSPALESLATVKVGAQNIYWEKEGAYTGEISTAMLAAMGVTHVIIGHSERRTYFGETDETVNKKLHAALTAGLTAIVCVGERLGERESGHTTAVLSRQCCAALEGESLQDVVTKSLTMPRASSEKKLDFAIAYEPIWAIGTGKTATPEMAAEAHAFIRAQVAKLLGNDVASQLQILYGGSVKPENAAALMAQQEIDGALVGGASLDPESFASVVKY